MGIQRTLTRRFSIRFLVQPLVFQTREMIPRGDHGITWVGSLNIVSSFCGAISSCVCATFAVRDVAKRRRDLARRAIGHLRSQVRISPTKMGSLDGDATYLGPFFPQKSIANDRGSWRATRAGTFGLSDVFQPSKERSPEASYLCCYRRQCRNFFAQMTHHLGPLRCRLEWAVTIPYAVPRTAHY